MPVNEWELMEDEPLLDVWDEQAGTLSYSLHSPQSLVPMPQVPGPIDGITCGG